MPVGTVATTGILMLARKASDKRQSKEEAEIAQQGLPPVPEHNIRWDASDRSASCNISSMPDELLPPHMHDMAESPTSISPGSPIVSNTEATAWTSHPKSLSSSSKSTPSDVHAVRVRTNGKDLKSGFPYHPGLFDLHVRPDDWQRFTDQVTDSTKFDSGDYAKMWAAAGSVALTGSVLTTAWVGRTMNRSIQEKKVTTGLVDQSPGSLGETLQRWNTCYFAPLGLVTHFELSDSAMRKPKQKSNIIRKPSLLYNTREERERRREDRKFVIVVTELHGADIPPTKAYEVAGDPGRVEMPVPEDPRAYTSELPGDTELEPVELPTAKDMAKEDVADILSRISELPGHTPVEHVVETRNDMYNAKLDDRPKSAKGSLIPPPLAVKSPGTA